MAVSRATWAGLLLLLFLTLTSANRVLKDHDAIVELPEHHVPSGKVLEENYGRVGMKPIGSSNGCNGNCGQSGCGECCPSYGCGGGSACQPCYSSPPCQWQQPPSCGCVSYPQNTEVQPVATPVDVTSQPKLTSPNKPANHHIKPHGGLD